MVAMAYNGMTLILIRYFPCTFIIIGQKSLNMENLDRLLGTFWVIFGKLGKVLGNFLKIFH